MGEIRRESRANSYTLVRKDQLFLNSRVFPQIWLWYTIPAFLNTYSMWGRYFPQFFCLTVHEFWSPYNLRIGTQLCRWQIYRLLLKCLRGKLNCISSQEKTYRLCERLMLLSWFADFPSNSDLSRILLNIINLAGRQLYREWDYKG